MAIFWERAVHSVNRVIRLMSISNSSYFPFGRKVMILDLI